MLQIRSTHLYNLYLQYFHPNNKKLVLLFSFNKLSNKCIRFQRYKAVGKSIYTILSKLLYDNLFMVYLAMYTQTKQTHTHTHTHKYFNTFGRGFLIPKRGKKSLHMRPNPMACKFFRDHYFF